MGCSDSRTSPNPNTSSHYVGNRTSTNAALRVRCAERTFDGFDKQYPVKVVIFDLDETLTLSTFMRPDLAFPIEQQPKYVRYNFQSPWIDGDRVPKLGAMLESLAKGKDGWQRAIAVLTKNCAGVKAVLGLLQIAGLSQYFHAVWVMPFSGSGFSGAYADGNDWVYFHPPRTRGQDDHKADVIHRLAKHPEAYFPQMQKGQLQYLQQLEPEGIVLVDDQRANFQSVKSGAKVLRYCKVARYDAVYRNFGLIRDMGGIGAHSDSDYDALVRFVEDPWMCKDTLRVRCQQRDLLDDGRGTPVGLVVFDFDETLTMATFMPKDPACETKIGWTPKENPAEDWNAADLVRYNFESPYVKGNRVAKLKEMFAQLRRRDDNGPARTFAVLTRNENGVVAVLNLLMLAGIADEFGVIWNLPWREDAPNAVYNDSGEWKCFNPPVQNVNDHKADVLQAVRQSPADWFPNLPSIGNPELEAMQAESIVLVDDERSNFRSTGESQAKVMRYCKVPRYDDVYRDCGLLNQMGGLGAHGDEDYSSLKSFVESPWEYPYETSPTDFSRMISSMPTDDDMLRESSEEVEAKAPRVRHHVDVPLASSVSI